MTILVGTSTPADALFHSFPTAVITVDTNRQQQKPVVNEGIVWLRLLAVSGSY
jgi:hypothetical protein